ncbi:hypothetical protein JCM19235_3657 [Vibrio maritimus]|uniref:Uncharacterized protein n=1 Tax=Vibrio maritimus TaxID=990268 RepID=A0A090RYV2_9VIBR|nr:hypothetical protein JCM19235_3657 [Vibrio maritimus]
MPVIDGKVLTSVAGFSAFEKLPKRKRLKSLLRAKPPLK